MHKEGGTTNKLSNWGLNYVSHRIHISQLKQEPEPPLGCSPPECRD